MGRGTLSITRFVIGLAGSIAGVVLGVCLLVAAIQIRPSGSPAAAFLFLAIAGPFVFITSAVGVVGGIAGVLGGLRLLRVAGVTAVVLNVVGASIFFTAQLHQAVPSPCPVNPSTALGADGLPVGTVSTTFVMQRAEATLVYPGATVLGQIGNGEFWTRDLSGRCGVNPAYTESFQLTGASFPRVEAWFSGEARALGLDCRTPADQLSAQPQMWVGYVRDGRELWEAGLVPPGPYRDSRLPADIRVPVTGNVIDLYYAVFPAGAPSQCIQPATRPTSQP